MDKSPTNFLIGPWRCAGLILVAITLGVLADGIADGVAAILLIVPSVLVFRQLLRGA